MAYKLFINYGTGLDIHFEGASITAPVKGARYSPGRGARRVDVLGREVIEEEIIIELAGTFRQITDWINALNVVLEMLKAGDWHKPDTYLTLRIEEADEASGYPWFSRILDAWLSVDVGGVAQRGLGQQAVTLKILRLDQWQDQDSVTTNVLYFPDGTGDQVTQGYLYNHYDSTAGHTNWGILKAASVQGDLPALAYLRFGGAVLGDLFVGCGWSDAAYPASIPILPTLQDSAWTAGTGVTKVTTAAATAAGGEWASFTWAGTAETEIARAVLPATLYALSHGRPMKIMGRLHSGTVVADLWLKARVVIGGTSVVVSETEWNLYTSGSVVLDLPVVYTPPEGLGETVQLDLVLYGLCPSGGGVINLDFVQLWPVDGGYRRLKGISYLGGTAYVVDDAANDKLYWTDNAINQRAVYVGVGPRILLAPGRDNVLALANIQTGTSWVIADQVNLYVVYNRTKRNL